jgi:AcrR family transcriptional regulator
MTHFNQAEINLARGRVTADDWIKAAQSVLVSNSIDAVRVKELSALLRITRGSFYHHFKNRDELLSRMIETWRDQAIKEIENRFHRARMNPQAFIRDALSTPLGSTPSNDGASSELAFRLWANRDIRVRKMLIEVDTARISCFIRCFIDVGFDSAGAEVRAFSLYGCALLEPLLTNHEILQTAKRRSGLEASLLAMDQVRSVP